MHKLDEPEDSIIPPDFLNASKQEKRIWLHRHTRNVLEKFVMAEQKTTHTVIWESVLRAIRSKTSGVCMPSMQ